MMTIKALAEAVGKPTYTVNYAMAVYNLCADHTRLGNARIFTDAHVEELKAHFTAIEKEEPPKIDKTYDFVDKPKSLFGD